MPAGIRLALQLFATTYLRGLAVILAILISCAIIVINHKAYRKIDELSEF